MDGIAAALTYPFDTAPAPGIALPIADGVKWLRLTLPFALDHINLWLVEDGPGWTVIDTGYANEESRAAWERIFETGIEGRPITRIFVTHYHPDHIGLAGWLCERWQAPLWIPEKEWLSARLQSREDDAEFGPVGRAFVQRAGGGAELNRIYAERHQGYRRGVPSIPPSFTRIAAGDRIDIGGREWQVLIGEGHSPELACLYCPEIKLLISADQVLPRISPNVSVAPQEPEGDPLARFLGSLTALKTALPPDPFVLPSHNLPFYGLHTRIDELVAHHHARCAQIVDFCSEPRTALEIMPLLFRRKLDGHQMAFALGEALAHLHYLRGRGALASLEDSSGVRRFTRLP